jgi:hypothetical protein
MTVDTFTIDHETGIALEIANEATPHYIRPVSTITSRTISTMLIPPLG